MCVCVCVCVSVCVCVCVCVQVCAHVPNCDSYSRRYPFHNFRREHGEQEWRGAHAPDTKSSEAGGEPTTNGDSPRRGGQEGGGGTPREGFEAAQQLRAAALSAEKLALLEVCLWVRPLSAAFLDAATRKSVD